MNETIRVLIDVCLFIVASVLIWKCLFRIGLK